MRTKSAGKEKWQRGWVCLAMTIGADLWCPLAAQTKTTSVRIHSDQTVIAPGESLTLRVEIQGTTNPNVRWYAKETPVPYSDRGLASNYICGPVTHEGPTFTYTPSAALIGKRVIIAAISSEAPYSWFARVDPHPLHIPADVEVWVGHRPVQSVSLLSLPSFHLRSNQGWGPVPGPVTGRHTLWAMHAILSGLDPKDPGLRWSVTTGTLTCAFFGSQSGQTVTGRDVVWHAETQTSGTEARKDGVLRVESLADPGKSLTIPIRFKLENKVWLSSLHHSTRQGEVMRFSAHLTGATSDSSDVVWSASAGTFTSTGTDASTAPKNYYADWQAPLQPGWQFIRAVSKDMPNEVAYWPIWVE